ncbi:MAG: acyltransferase [Muribaculaceae bacterium]|nr:acyltransferase [Muribaculaceae bacterium]
MSVAEKERIQFIDLAKGICIILVVSLHIVPSIDEKLVFLPYLRMPLYYCLSGLFYKDYGSFKNFTLKKVNNILIPFVAWYVIGYAIYYLGRAVAPADHESLYHFDDIFVRSSFFNIPIWFLLSLFWSNILFTGINAISKKWVPQLLMIVAMAGIGLLMSHYEVFNFLYFGVTLSCMPFFFMGYMLKRSALLYPSSSKKKDFFIMMGCLILGMVFALYPETSNRLVYFSNRFEGHFSIFYITAICLVIGLLLLTKFINHIPFVSYLGRYSIIVLITHSLLKSIYQPFLSRIVKLDIDPSYLEVVLLILILASMLIVIPFCKKYLPYITAQKQIFEKKIPGKLCPR